MSGLPISSIGGISNWRDAAEFIFLGSNNVQDTTMHYGFRIVEDMIDGLSNWMDEKVFETLDDFRGLMSPNMSLENLNLNYHTLAKIDYDKCIDCHLCYAPCEDGAHQSIKLAHHDVNGSQKLRAEIIEDSCVGCNHVH